ncbi:DUF397 domain-containing protein [Streptomyces sp. 3N207]|uniref:DUF397 domain-containing protein n=1 Tax=Streptomyces sp. 3N207 TaxID=3457417 RepID=UPI003FCF4A10
MRSSYTDQQGGHCVEWAPGLVSGGGVVPVRDSKDTTRAPLSFSPDAWQTFIDGVKRCGAEGRS